MPIMCWKKPNPHPLIKSESRTKVAVKLNISWIPDNVSLTPLNLNSVFVQNLILNAYSNFYWFLSILKNTGNDILCAIFQNLNISKLLWIWVLEIPKPQTPQSFNPHRMATYPTSKFDLKWNGVIKCWEDPTLEFLKCVSF